MKNKLKRIAASVLTLALLAVPVLAAAEPVGSRSLNVADGTVYTYSTQAVTSDSGKQTNLHENIFSYKKETQVRPVVAFGSTLYGTSPMNKTIKTLEEQGYSMVAGINGSFFDRATGIPYGIVVTNSILRSGGSANAVGFLADGSALIGDPTVAVTLDYGADAPLVLNYNKAMTVQNGVLLYSQDYDTRTKNTIEGYHVIVRPVGSRAAELRLGQSLTVEVVGMVEDTKSCSIPEDGFLLAVANDTAYKSALTALRSMVMGQQMTLQVTCASGWENVTSAAGGGDMLVENGQVCTDFTLDSAKKMAARTAIGVTNDGSLILYTCDEAGNSDGLTLAQLAERMLALGCRTALNLDGGGSTAAGVTYPGYASGATANVPSDGKLRECANFIFLVRQKQDAGAASKLYLYPFGGYALPGAKLTMTIKAADSSYMAAAVPTNVTFGGSNVTQTSGSTVTVEPGARGAATVTAAAGSLRASATFEIPAAPTSITIKQEGKNTPLTALHIAGGSKTDLTATAWYYGNQVYSADESFEWAVTGEIGEIDGSGVFTAAKTGTDLTGTITASYGETSFTLKVTVGSSQPFADTKGHWAESYITDLYYAGTLQGSTKDGKLYYRPDASMTRQEFIVAMMRYLGTDLSAYQTVSLPFVDSSSIADWAKSAMQAAYSLGYLTGSKTNGQLLAKPGATISRQEAMTILSRTKDFPEADLNTLSAFSDSGKIADWAKTALAQMAQQKIISGSKGKLNPTGKVTRAEVAKMLYMLSEL